MGNFTPSCHTSCCHKTWISDGSLAYPNLFTMGFSLSFWLVWKVDEICLWSSLSLPVCQLTRSLSNIWCFLYDVIGCKLQQLKHTVMLGQEREHTHTNAYISACTNALLHSFCRSHAMLSPVQPSEEYGMLMRLFWNLRWAQNMSVVDFIQTWAPVQGLKMKMNSLCVFQYLISATSFLMSPQSLSVTLLASKIPPARCPFKGQPNQTQAVDLSYTTTQTSSVFLSFSLSLFTV